MPNQINQNQIPSPNPSPLESSSSTPVNLQALKGKKRFPLVTILIGALVLVSIITLLGFLVWNSNRNANIVPTVRLNLTGFNSTYTVGSDFRISNEQNLEKRENNRYLAIKTDYSIDTIRTGALKLALSNEAFNANANFRAFTRQGVNDLNSDFITVDHQNRYIQVRYASGINSSTINENDAYTFISDYFGLVKNNVETFSTNKDGNAISLTYRYKIKDQIVHFDGVEDIYTTLRIVDGKITEVFAFLIPLETEEKEALNPIDKINSANLAPLNYQIRFESDDLSSSSQYGGEKVFISPAEIGFRKSTPIYKAWNDPVKGYMILPSYLLNGVYIDASQQRGTFMMVVVNQGL